MVQHQN